MADDFDGEMLSRLASPDLVAAHPDFSPEKFKGDSSVRDYAYDAARVYGDLLRERLPESEHASVDERAVKFEGEVRGRVRHEVLRQHAARETEHVGLGRDYESAAAAIPFANTMPRIGKAIAYPQAHKKFEEENASEGDYRVLARQQAEERHAETAGRGERALEAVTQFPAVAAEFLAGGGAGAAARHAATEGLVKGTAKLGPRAVGWVTSHPRAAGMIGQEVGALGEMAGRTAVTAGPRAAAAYAEGGPSAALRETASAGLENLIFAQGGVVADPSSRSFVRKVAGGLGAVLANHELQRGTGLQGGETYLQGIARGLATGDTGALKDLAADAAVVTALEGAVHYLGAQRRKGYRVDEDAMARAAVKEIAADLNARTVQDAEYEPAKPAPRRLDEREAEWEYQRALPGPKRPPPEPSEVPRQLPPPEEGRETTTPGPRRLGPPASQAERPVAAPPEVGAGPQAGPPAGPAQRGPAAPPAGEDRGPIPQGAGGEGRPAGPAEGDALTAAGPRESGSPERPAGPAPAGGRPPPEGGAVPGPAAGPVGGGRVLGDGQPAPGMVRVYRGEYGGKPVKISDWTEEGIKASGSKDAQGRWWTPDPETAAWHKQDAGEHGRIVYQDIPADVVEQSRMSNQPDAAKFSRDKSNELYLPKEYAGKGVPVETEPAAPAAPAESLKERMLKRGLAPAKARVPLVRPRPETARQKLERLGEALRKAPAEEPEAARERRFDEAGLTDEERRVLTLREAGKSFRDIAPELGVSYQTVKNREASARAKLGEKGSVAATDYPRQQAEAGEGRSYRGRATAEAGETGSNESRRALAAVENGADVAAEDLHEIDPEGYHHNAAIRDIGDAVEAMDELSRKRRLEEQRGPLSPERQQEYAAKFERLRRRIDAGQGEAGPAAQEPTAARGAPGEAAQERQGEVAPEVRGGPRGRPGFIDLTPLADAARTVAGSVERALAEPPESTKAQGILRHRNAQKAQQADRNALALRDGERFFWGHTEAQKDPALRERRFLEFMDAVESGKLDTLPQPLRKFAEVYRALHDEYTQPLRDLGLVTAFIDNHVGHLWEDPRNPKATPEEIAAVLKARRPLSGSESFRKRRVLPTYRDGIEAGLVPKSWNPITLAKMEFDQYSKAIFGRRAFKEMTDEGLAVFVRLGDRGPQGWRTPRVPDKLWEIFAPDMRLTGHYYLPDSVATLLENHLGEGLGGSAAFRAFRGLGNQMTQLILGWSGFHATATALNVQFIAAAEALRAASRGEWQRAAGLVPSASVPLYGAARAVKTGLAVEREWFSPGSGTPEGEHLENLLEIGGGRMAGGHEYLGTSIDHFKKALAFIKEGRYGKVPAALLYALPALNQLVAKPVMSRLVPLAKVGVFSDMAQAALARMPDADIHAKRAALRKSWDHVENVMGLLTYDNLFMRRWLRDLCQASFLSFGWNLGDVRLIADAGKAVVLPSRWKEVVSGQGVDRGIGFLLSLMGATAMYGAFYQWIATGEGPSEPKDLFFPKDGTRAKDGSAGRKSLPTYMKDLAALTHRAGDSPLKIPQNAWGMAKHKLNPAVTLLGEILDNTDWKGAAITNPSDPWATQGKDWATHFLDRLVPISVKQGSQAGDWPERLQGAVGITPAPGFVRHTDAEERAAEQKNPWSPVSKKIREERRVNNGVIPRR